LLVEGGKQVYAATPTGERSRLRAVRAVARPVLAASHGQTAVRLALRKNK
jgi:hypothetical protein